MSDYSDIFYLMGAIILYSILTLSVNRAMVAGQLNQVDNVVEYHAITVAQEIVDELRWAQTEGELNNMINAYPDTVYYNHTNNPADRLLYVVDVSSTTSLLENSNIRGVDLFVDVSNDFTGSGTNGGSLRMTVTKSFVK